MIGKVAKIISGNLRVSLLYKFETRNYSKFFFLLYFLIVSRLSLVFKFKNININKLRIKIQRSHLTIKHCI